MERVLACKTRWLAEHGYGITVITTDQLGRKPYFPLHPAIKSYDLGINYDATNGRSFLTKAVQFPLKQWRHRRRLTALLHQLKADVVVCMFNNDVSFVYKIKDGSRKVLEVHFSKEKKLQYARSGLWRLADRWRTWREERIVRRYDKFVVLTHEDKTLWGELPNITVIPNARTFEPTCHADLSQRRVLAVGRLDYQKGFDRLLYIWYRLGDNIKGWNLDIVGDGPLHDELSAMVVKIGLTESVHLLRPTSDIMSLYLRSSILVMTSRYEGLPMALLEAQAFGLPIVSYACKCGPRDIITDGKDGFLVPDGEETVFADRLLRLMNDKGLRDRMGSAAAKASQRYSEEHIMRQWEELFECCVTQRLDNQ